MKDVDIESGLLVASGLPPNQAFVSPQIMREYYTADQALLAQQVQAAFDSEHRQWARQALQMEMRRRAEVERVAPMQTRYSDDEVQAAMRRRDYPNQHTPPGFNLDAVMQMMEHVAPNWLRQEPEPAPEEYRNYAEQANLIAQHAAEMARMQAELDRLRQIAIQQAPALPQLLPPLLPGVEIDETDNPAFQRPALKQVEGQVLDGN